MTSLTSPDYIKPGVASTLPDQLSLTVFSTGPAESATFQEILFIDAALPNVDVLVADVRSDVAVVLLQPGEDPWLQISSILGMYQGLTAVHLVSHGQAGALVLNGKIYDASGILAESDLLAGWSASLAPGADFLLYGCNVGSGQEGVSLLATLSRLAQVDVAASDNLTGASASGGDWVLEQNTGSIGASSAFSNAVAVDYTEVLTTGIYSSTTGTNVDTAGVTTGLIGAGKLITFNPINVTATDAAAKLVIRAYDVDYGLKNSSGVPYAAGDANSEWDGVYIQKQGDASWSFVGYLNGTNNNWSYTTFDVSSIVTSTGNWIVRVVPDDNGTQTQANNGGRWVVGTSIAELFMGSGSLISSLTESGQSVTSQWLAPIGNYTIQYLLLDATGRAVAQVNSSVSENVANATQTNSNTLAVNTNFYSSWSAIPTGTYTLQATLFDAAGVVQDVKTSTTSITGSSSSSSSSTPTTTSSKGTNYTIILGNTSWTGSTAADLAHTATADTTPTLTGYVYAKDSSSSARLVDIYMDGVLIGSTYSTADGTSNGTKTYNSAYHGYAWTFTVPTAISLTVHTFTAKRDGSSYVQSSPYSLTIDAAVTPAITGLTSASWSGNTDADLASQADHAATPHTTGDQTPALVGTAGKLSSLAIYDGSTLLGYTTTDSGGNWTFQVGDLAPLANVTHSFTARDTSTGGTSSAYSLAVDSTAPAQAVSITSISADTGVSGDFITATAGQAIYATLSSVLQAGQRLLGSIDGGVTWGDASTAVNGTSVAWTGRTLKTGYADPAQLVPWAIEFKVVDGNNLNGPIAKQDYQLIQIAGSPVISTIASSSSSSVTTNYVRPVFTGTADANTVVDVYAGATLLGSAAVDASGNWTFSPVSNINSGTYTIKAVERDPLSGYVSQESSTKTLVVNTSLPLITLNSASDSGTYNSDAITSNATPSVRVDFSSLWNSGVTVTTSDTVQILKGGVQIGSSSTLTSANISNRYIDITTASLGSDANVSLSAKIVHGSSSYTTNDLGLTLDKTAPSLSSATVDGSVLTLNYTEAVGVAPNEPTDTQFAVTIAGSSAGIDTLVYDPVAKTVTMLLDTAAAPSDAVKVSYTQGSGSAVKLLDLAGNAAANFSLYTVSNITDTTAPVLSSIVPQSPSTPTNADAVTFQVTFTDASGGVANVDISDFVAKLNGTAVNIAAVTQVSGLVYDVLVNDSAIALANGNLVLSLATQSAGMDIIDGSNQANALANNTATTGTYVLDNTAPAAVSITSVTDDISPVMGTLGNPGSTNDLNLTVRVSLTASGALAGDHLQLYNGTDTSSPLGSSYTLTSTDITHGYADVPTGTLENGVTYTLSARVADALGNQGPVSGNSFVETIDSTAPAAPGVDLFSTSDSGTSQSDDKTNVTSPVLRVAFNGTGSSVPAAGDVVKLYDGAVQVGTATLTNGDITAGYVDISSSTLTAGSLSFTATVTDAAGNISNASTALPVTLDTTAPVLANAAVIGNTLTLTYSEAGVGMDGTAPATTDFAVMKNSGTTVSVSGVAVDASSRTVTLTLGSSVTNTDSNVIVSYTPGTNKIQDIAANAALALTDQPVTITSSDTSIPTVAITDNVSGTLNIADGTITYTFTFSEPVTGFTDADVTVTNGSKGTITVQSSMICTLLVTPTAGYTGDVTVDVAYGVASDGAGNLNLAATQSVQAVDLVAPAVPTVSSLTTSDTTPTITGTATVGSGETLAVTVNGATYGNVSVDGTGHWSIDTGTVTPGSGTLGTFTNGQGYSVTATVTDAAGNVSTDATSSELLIDTTAPPTTVAINSITADTGSSSSDFITKDNDGLTVSATLSTALATGEHLEYSRDNGTSWSTVSSGISGTSVSFADASLTGSATIRFRVVDAAGNAGTEASQAIVIDTTAPAVPTVTTQTTNDTTPTIVGTATVGSGETLSVTVNGATYGNVSVDGSAHWSIDTSSVTPGSGTLGTFSNGQSYSVTATVTDAAGNATSDTTGSELAIDTTTQVNLLDHDGISSSVESALANLAGGTADQNGDGVDDANQNAVTTLAWINKGYFDEGLAGTLATSEPVVSIEVLRSTSGSTVDGSAQLFNIAVLDPASAVTGGSKPANALWDPIKFSVESRAGMSMQDIDPAREGMQIRVYIDISNSETPAGYFTAYRKYVSLDSLEAAHAANIVLHDLDGAVVSAPGWYDFTQRETGGDGARFVASGGHVVGIELIITDNAFGDNDMAAGNICDPGVPVVGATPTAYYGVELGSGDRKIFTGLADAEALAATRGNSPTVEFYGVADTLGDETVSLKAWYNTVTGDWLYAPEGVAPPYACYVEQNGTVGLALVPGKGAFDVHLYENSAGITQSMGEAEAAALGLLDHGYSDLGAIFASSAPVVIGFSPADGAQHASVDGNIVLAFSDDVRRGAGTIAIHQDSPSGSVVESYSAATDSTHLLFDGNKLTIDPSGSLLAEHHYYVTLAGGTVVDQNGNEYPGTTSFDFWTKSVHDAEASISTAGSSGGSDAGVIVGSVVGLGLLGWLLL
ncbi:MAG: DUF4347 domain-containing protein [Chlorobiaceae bacterium]|nr:DUF4347 domain-containing protein [Chlorobiaceae bacterium]